MSRSRSRSNSRERPHAPRWSRNSSYSSCEDSDDSPSSYRKKYYELKVKDAPLWSFKTFRDYLRNNTKYSVVRNNMPFAVPDKKEGVFLLRFWNYESYKLCHKELSEMVIEGQRLRIEPESPDDEFGAPVLVEDSSDNDSVLSLSKNKPFEYKKLLVENAPNWTWDRFRGHIKQQKGCLIIKTHTPHVTKVNTNSFILTFQSSASCIMGYKELNKITIGGRKLMIKPVSDDYVKVMEKIDKKVPNTKPEPVAVGETYGLHANFLNSLNIELPLVNRIMVENLLSTVTREKLLEIFSMAGHVLSVVILPTFAETQCAKIEYDHPVEAVQAISMFNNQSLYQHVMRVRLDKEQWLHLPAGLSGLGPGLGKNREPLKGVRYSVEIEPIKQVMLKELVELKSLKNMEISKQAMANTITNLGAPFQAMGAFNGNNPICAPNLAIPNFFPPPTMPVTEFPVPAYIPPTPLMVPPVPDFNITAPLNTSYPQVSKQEPMNEDPMQKSVTSDLLVLTNLPSSVTIQALKNKMSEIGVVEFADITSEGRGIVRFQNPDDAQRCINLFHNSRVDGKLIEVRLL